MSGRDTGLGWLCRVEQYLFWLCLLLLGQKLVGERGLECSAQAEDAVVCFFLGETLQRQEDGFGFFGDEVVGSVEVVYQHISSSSLILKSPSLNPADAS